MDNETQLDNQTPSGIIKPTALKWRRWMDSNQQMDEDLEMDIKRIMESTNGWNTDVQMAFKNSHELLYTNKKIRCFRDK